MAFDEDFYKRLKKELKQEILNESKAQIRELIEKEVYNLIFKEKHFETPLRAYILSLALDDIHYTRMLNRGLVKNQPETIIFNRSDSIISIVHLKEEIDLETIFEKYADLMPGCDFEIFERVVTFRKEPKDMINWIEKSKKGFTYYGLFEMLDEIYREDFYELESLRKRHLMAYLSVSFRPGGLYKETDNFIKSFNRRYGSNK